MSLDELQNRIIDKQQEIDRLEFLVERRRNELDAEASTIHDLEISLGTSTAPTLRELGKEVAPEDYLDMVNRLENRLKLQQMRTNAAQKEVQETRLANKQTEDAIEQLFGEEARIRAITGYRSPEYARKSNHVCSKLSSPEQNMLLQELRILVTRIREEQKITRDIIHQKDKVVESLVANKADVDEKTEELFILRNKVKASNNEMNAISEEYETFRREHLKADKAINRLESQNDSGCLSSLLQDKLFLKAKIYEHVDMRRAQDKAIKAQSFRLQHLQARADAIADAVTDLKMTERVSACLKGTVAPIEEPVCSLDIETILPSDESVDLALYELLSRDVEAINHSIGLKDIILLEKEAAIESLEEKLERVFMANAGEIDLKEEEIAYMEQQVRGINQDVRSEREAYFQEISSLRQEKTRAQKQVLRARSQRRSISPS
ncbi:hypothetical protein DIPPA_20522 [Diplonema papillatum]|nr:hypothetical protein DIPPA_20522 [Diplonema papillatum]